VTRSTAPSSPRLFSADAILAHTLIARRDATPARGRYAPVTMTQETWTAVDRYIADHLLAPDDALKAALEMSEAAGLPAINVSPPQGKLLMMLAQLHGARTVLEVGTLGGYSTIGLARALPRGGRVITLEVDPKHAKIATANLARAGLSEVVEVIVGPALETLPQIEAQKRGPFDFVFIDADKPNNPNYVAWALKLTRKGSVIIVDNVVREGAVIDAKTTDPRIQGTRRVFEMLAAEPRLSATAIQTVGSKGYDGFAVAIVTS
jgi:predicted O-methyltransferase YrrM